ncbi:hypothetical protein SAMN05660964_03822 [Thiothrix caldifontis]|uniref:Uncharacterized protein n=2 Tax=Thiothrix caldifontis TaxID=525918 RepID=A0A1H4GYX0_9GAMM|nr:hypothetical protein SAMN05660964_03822 [Thiothrix caldifontis]
MGSLTRVLESRQVNRGRPIPDAKRGHDPDAGLAGGASVVVRDGESPLHGEGGQFKQVCHANYLTLVR